VVPRIDDAANWFAFVGHYSTVLHVVRIVPIRVTKFNAPLFVHARSVVAYRAECSCGERGPSRPNVQAARVWRQSHIGRK